MTLPLFTRFPVVFISASLLLVSLASCGTSVSISEGTIEPEAEAHYREAWARGSRAIANANEGFRSGVCNVGGDQQGCSDASGKVIDAINRFFTDLEAIAVPTRYREGDGASRDALKAMREGFELRNEGLLSGNDVKFVGGNDKLKAAVQALQRAHEEFPVDARPTPPL